MSGIVVASAIYGVGSTTVDVTTTVTSMIKDGVLSIPSVSPAVFNVTDPAPGQGKTLTVKYSINGGKKLTQTINDSGSFNIDAPPQRIASGLQIVKAEYGVDGNMNDVTDAVRSKIKNGNIDLKVGFKQLGVPDPNPSQVKSFSVDFTINGAQNSLTLKDGDSFRESAPAVQTSSGTPAQQVQSAVGMIGTNIVRFFQFFLWSLSFFMCLRFGSTGDRIQILWGGLGLIPMFGFIGLPLYVLVVRLFSDSDFVV